MIWKCFRGKIQSWHESKKDFVLDVAEECMDICRFHFPPTTIYHAGFSNRAEYFSENPVGLEVNSLEFYH
jgi:hypothetical protein